MPGKESQKPNVILMMGDSLRADHVGCYGLTTGPSRTPHFDNLAARSVLFLNAFSAGPYTAFAMPALFTGRYPCRLKMMEETLPFWRLHGATVEGTRTIAEVLQAEGYHTAAFHCNALLSRYFGFQKGFDVFYDDLLLGSPSLPKQLRRMAVHGYRLLRSAPHLSAKGLNEKVLAWLDHAQEPFFLLLQYMDTHGPYLQRKVLKYISPGERAWRVCNSEPERVTSRQHVRLVQNYRSQVSYLDSQWGQLWQELEARGLFDRSFLIVSADHGEEFRDHGGYSHHCKLYDEMIHVPMLIHSRQAPPRRVSDLIESFRLGPTILELAGIDPSELGGLDATSFLPLLRGEEYSPKHFTYSEAGPTPHDHVCVRTKEWKLIWKQAGAIKELYQLRPDPREQVNVAAEYPQVVEELESRVLAHFASPSRSAAGSVRNDQPSDGVGPSKAEQILVEERLRDLGYI